MASYEEYVAAKEAEGKEPWPRERWERLQAGKQKAAASLAAPTNPDCSNEACLVTCHPECPNLYSNQEYDEWRREERAAITGDDPTIRSTDVF